MTKQQAKAFARIYVGQSLFTHYFDKDCIDATDEDKDLIKYHINELFIKMLGSYGYMEPQEIYDLINIEE